MYFFFCFKSLPNLCFWNKRWWWQNSTTKMAAERPLSSLAQMRRREAWVPKSSSFLSGIVRQQTKQNEAQQHKRDERGGKKTWNGSENSREKPIPLFKLKRSCYRGGGFQTRRRKKKGRNCVHYEARSILTRRYKKSFESLNAILKKNKKKKKSGVCTFVSLFMDTRRQRCPR